MIQDSGERTQYETGAVRDCKAGKGRFDLMPLDILAEVMGDPAITAIARFKESGDYMDLVDAIRYSCDEDDDLPFFYGNPAAMMLEVAKHFEEGAEKYGPNNWQKGIPVHSYIDSALRHYMKVCDGYMDEQHDRAFIWNLMCCAWTVKHHPEMDDFTAKGYKRAAEKQEKGYGGEGHDI